MEGPDLVRSKCPNDSMENTAVVEKHKVVLFPIMGIDKLWVKGSLTFVKEPHM